MTASKSVHGPSSQRLADVASAIPTARGEGLRVLAVLFAAPGRMMAYDTIAADLRNLTGEYPDMEQIRTGVKRARAALRASGLPISIEGMYGVGYRVVADPSWHPPWLAPASREADPPTRAQIVDEVLAELSALLRAKLLAD